MVTVALRVVVGTGRAGVDDVRASVEGGRYEVVLAEGIVGRGRCGTTGYECRAGIGGGADDVEAIGVGIGEVDLDPDPDPTRVCCPKPKVCPLCPFLNPNETSIPHPPSSLACINAVRGSTPSSPMENSSRRTKRPVIKFFPSPGSLRALLTRPFPVHTSPPCVLLLISGLASNGDEAADRRRWGGWILTRDLRRYVSRGSKV